MFNLFKVKDKKTQEKAQQTTQYYNAKSDNTDNAPTKTKEAHGSKGVCCGSCGGQ